MGKYVNNGIVSIPAEHKFGSQDDILEELGGLLNVGRRTDGKFHHADINTAENIREWQKCKPIEVDKAVNITETDRYNANQGFNLTWNTTINNISSSVIDTFNNSGATWEYIKPSKYFRIRDFHGYNHNVNTTPFQATPNTQTEDGIELEETSDSATYCYCYWHQRPTSIQPKDMAIFGEYQSTHYLKIGAVIMPPSGTGKLYMIYNSKNDADTDNAANAVDMPLSRSESDDPHIISKWIKLPKSTAASNAKWRAMFVCVRVNKTTGDKAWIPLPTMRDISFTIANTVADIGAFWSVYGGNKMIKVVANPSAVAGRYDVYNIYFNNSFFPASLFSASGLSIKFEIAASSSSNTLYSRTIDQNSTPVYVQSSGTDAMVYFSTPIKDGSSAFSVVLDDLVVYLSGTRGNTTIYYKLDEVVESGIYKMIPKATTSRVGYKLKDIFAAIGTSNYEIVAPQ